MPTLIAEVLPDGTCVLRLDDAERWRSPLGFGDAMAWNPFREALVWPTARRVVAAAGDRIHLLDLETGELRITLILSPDLFGHLALVDLAEGDATTELLLVLGWTDVRAYDASASLRWHARGVAVDGITFDHLDGAILRIHAEMDPPGGWFSVSLDATTGHELALNQRSLPATAASTAKARSRNTDLPSLAQRAPKTNPSACYTGPTTMRNPAHWLSLGLAFGLLAACSSSRGTTPPSSTTATTTPTSDPGKQKPATDSKTCAAATLPDTPVGRQATELLDVVNSGDRTRIEALVTQRFTPQFRGIVPMDRHLEVIGGFHDETGGVTVCRVEYASETEALLLLASNRGNDLHGLTIRIEEADPYRLSNLSIQPAPREALDDPPAPLDDAGRSAIVEGVATALDGYIFADVAAKMKERIRFERDAGHYTAFTHPLPLVRQLTKDLRDVSKDKHLAIHYSAATLPPEVGQGDAEPPPPTPEELEQLKAAAAQDGFGIAKVEILEGNIGYIDIRLFHQVHGVREAFTEAMTKLADTKALIVDVRQHHGGDPATVAFVTSYLFGDEKVHLNDLYYRRSDLTTEYWTDPKVPGKRFGKKKPVYVLTSNETFSGGEELAYNLRVLKRATLVGETTGGGAHPVDGVRVDDHIVAIVPVGRAINPITKSNWEGKGVEPHVPVPAGEALDKAKALLAAKK